MKSLTVDGTPEECYRAWRNLESFPRFLSFVDSVRPHGDKRFRWVAHERDGEPIEWDVDLVEDWPGDVMVWRSIPGSDVETVGVVEFEPAHGNRGTVVRLGLQHSKQKLQAKKELHRFKQWFETGEVATTGDQPSGARSAIGRMLKKGEGS
jgi:uncharacterized membrane protein